MYRINDVVKQLTARQTTCVKLAEDFLARCEATKEHNFWAYLNPEQVLDRARKSDKRYDLGRARLFEGIPVALKDNVDTTFQPTTGSTASFAGRVPKRTSEVAQRMVDAGMNVVGKTIMHELAFGITTNNHYTGTVSNGRNPDHTCGGSSGGSGAVVGAHLVPVALGTDTGGSIRIPSACNGVYGYKPTIDWYPHNYGIKMTHLRDSVGPIATYLDNILEVNKLYYGTDVHYRDLNPRNIKIGLPKYYYSALDEQVEGAAREAIDRMKDAGVTFVEGDIPDMADLLEKISGPTIVEEILPRLQDYLDANGYNDLTPAKVMEQIQSPDVMGYFQAGFDSTMTEAEYNDIVRNVRGQLVQNFQNYFQETGVDAIFYPTITVPVPKKCTDDFTYPNGDVVPLMTAIGNVDPASNTNSPAVVLPGREDSNGMNVGLELCSPTGTDTHLFEVAKLVDKIIR